MRHLGGVVDGEFKQLLDRVGAAIKTHVCANQKCGAAAMDIYPGGVCKACHDRGELIRFVAAVNAQLPVIYRGKGFSDIRNVGNLLRVKAELEAAVIDRTSLYIFGETGVGKTLLTAAGLTRLAMRGCPVRWVRMIDLLVSIKRAYSPGALTSDYSVIANLSDFARRGVLIIDDVGSETTTLWVKQAFYDLVDRIYGQGGCLWLTSNLRFSELAERYRPPDQTDSPIASRLAQMCKVIHVDAPDYRAEHRNL